MGISEEESIRRLTNEKNAVWSFGEMGGNYFCCLLYYHAVLQA